MKILYDECLPLRLKKEIQELNLFSVKDMNWEGKKNGELLKAAVSENFDAFITVDKNLRFQVNFDELKISLVVLDVSQNKLKNILELKKEIIKVVSRIESSNIFILHHKNGTIKIK